jgi:pimeloyl-ACP methyl ester carboxylesterase
MSLDLCAQPADLNRRMAELLRYTGVESPPPEDVARMAELWTRAQQPGLGGDERRTAFRDLFVLYARLHGQDLSSRLGGMENLARFAAMTVGAGGSMDLALPEPRGVPKGEYLHVETRGNGPVPLLLIPDVGVDGRKLYDSFARRNAGAYTMYIVTLPWAGAARPLPWPERLDYAARPWLNQIESELLALIDQPKLKGAVVTGTASGGYFAARLALLRPQRVRAAVLVDALVNATMRSAAHPDAPASPAERAERLKVVLPTPQLFPSAPVPPAAELRRLIDDPSSAHPVARNWWAYAVKDTSLSKAWTYEALSNGFFLPGFEYRWELFTTDLTEELQHLSVPMLAMGAIHDEGSPSQSPPSLSQWEEIKLLRSQAPQAPLTVVAFEDSRSYISVEYPQEFDRALADFLAGRPVHGKTGYSLPRTSPRASVMEAVGGGETRIAYGRPAVQQRKVWGELVPYSRVWRAGANEATTMTFTQDVQIEGHALAAGTYTFFVIPGEADWTGILNRVPRQWGAFDYNPAFDALRFPLKPVDGPHAEYLTYSIEPDGKDGAVVSLDWEKKRISFRVEAASP